MINHMILGGHVFINVCLCAHIVRISKSKRRNLNLVAMQIRERGELDSIL